MSKRSPFHILLPAVATMLVAAPLTGTAQSGTNGVAYVAVQAVLQRTPGYTAAENTWNQEFEGYQREMAQIQSRMDSATAAFEQQAVMLSPSNRAAERKKLEDQAAALQQTVAELRQKMQERQRQLLDPIEERVIAVIEGLRAEGNYSVVLDVSSQGNAVVAADKGRDLTAKAIDRLTAGSGTPEGN